MKHHATGIAKQTNTIARSLLSTPTPSTFCQNIRPHEKKRKKKPLKAISVCAFAQTPSILF